MQKTILILWTLFFIGCGSSSGGEHSSFNISNISPLIDVNDTYLIEENTREAFQVKATDNTSLKYYISGEDAHLLYIDTITGELFFNEPTNYNKIPTYNFILIVEDSVGNRTIKEITIKIKEGEKTPTPPETITKKRAFITTWDTTSDGVSQYNQITIPTIGNGYNYTVDWGDGSSSTNLTVDATHTYQYTGRYTVKITGQFPRIYFTTKNKKKTDAKKIFHINQWGDNEWESMGGAFSGCSNLSLSANDTPNLSNVTDAHKMLEDCQSIFDIDNWDVSHITDMSSMFRLTGSYMKISSWDVSHVTNMQHMFDQATNFNQDISAWDTSSVKNMSYMFTGATAFQHKDLSSWDVSNITSSDAHSNFFFNTGPGNIEPKWKQ